MQSPQKKDERLENVVPVVTLVLVIGIAVLLGVLIHIVSRNYEDNTVPVGYSDRMTYEDSEWWAMHYAETVSEEYRQAETIRGTVACVNEYKPNVVDMAPDDDSGAIVIHVCVKNDSAAKDLVGKTIEVRGDVTVDVYVRRRSIDVWVGQPDGPYATIIT